MTKINASEIAFGVIPVIFLIIFGGAWIHFT